MFYSSVITSISEQMGVNSHLSDPHCIEHDLQQLVEEMDPLPWRVLQKLNSQSSNQSHQILGLQEQLGPMVTTTHYFLNGKSEPQYFKNDQTVMENILGLKLYFWKLN